MALSGAPRTMAFPFWNTMSSGAASREWATMRDTLSLSLRAAPTTAPVSMTVMRLPPGPAPGRPCCESSYVTVTWDGSTPNSSATVWATTVSGLFPQNGENMVTTNSPVGPRESPTLSGTAVRPGVSYQNQNSVGP